MKNVHPIMQEALAPFVAAPETDTELLRKALEAILHYTSFYENPEDLDISKIRSWASDALKQANKKH